VDLRHLAKPESLRSFCSKRELYEATTKDLRALLEGEPDAIANAANTASLVYHELPEVNWAGFYFFKGGQLVVGPFQGKPACARLTLGKGVCGTAAAERKTVVVPDVRQFPGHIACDSASASEIVVPMVADGYLIGVFDVDSPVAGRFDDEDRVGLESIVRVFLEAVGGKLLAEPSYSD
jgi:L-methionine (R)-S-oxide reductase